MFMCDQKVEDRKLHDAFTVSHVSQTVVQPISSLGVI